MKVSCSMMAQGHLKIHQAVAAKFKATRLTRPLWQEGVQQQHLKVGKIGYSLGWLLVGLVLRIAERGLTGLMSAYCLLITQCLILSLQPPTGL